MDNEKKESPCARCLRSFLCTHPSSIIAFAVRLFNMYMCLSLHVA